MSMKRRHLSLAVRDAVANAPATLRALAREAGVPHTTLVRVGAGEIEASPALAERLAAVFERWGEVCKRHGFRVRQELYRVEREGRTAYSPLRGGHAPRVLRDAFSGWVQSTSPDVSHPLSLHSSLDVEGRAVSLEWLLGQLWNCTDVLPTHDCEALSIPPGSTYARAVRMVKRSVKERSESARRKARPKDSQNRGAPGELGPVGEPPDVEVRPYRGTSISPAALAEDEVHLWSLSLNVEEEVVRRFERCLSGEERRRIARLRFAELRRSRALSRGLLRHLLAAYVGLPAERLRLRDGPFGKPELTRVAERPPGDGSTVERTSDEGVFEAASEANIGFNVSHSGDLMLIAVAPIDRVGVDVEQIRPMDQAKRIAERYFCPSEWASIRDAPPGRTTETFLKAWTRKEAVAKAMGEGIVRLLGRLEVTTAPDEPARLLSIEGDTSRAARWSLFQLDPAEGYTGALAVEGRAWRVRAWSAVARQFLLEESDLP